MSTENNPVGSSPWHRGELAIQASIGVVDKMDDFGRKYVRNYLTEQHRLFYPQLPFIVAGTVDNKGNPWATLLTGRPGFLTATDDHTLHVSVRHDERDPASSGIAEGGPIGVLGIELHTRRRNRLNGVISSLSETGFDIRVVHSYGNCPRYIHLRDYAFHRDPATSFSPVSESLVTLDKQARSLIEHADMFFVATYSDEEGGRQVDGSHRGGKPGFVRVDDDGLLTIPDFNGNLFFNTLGNILLNGRAGLLFVDPKTGDVLQMTGEAEVVLDSPEIEAFRGAERLWTFKASAIVRRRNAIPLHWKDQEGADSPFSQMTGDWHQASERILAGKFTNAWRPMRVERIVEESSVIRSIILAPVDGAGLLSHKAGQHLSVRLQNEGRELVRQYTLSVAPSDNVYRISVKRQGAFSQLLHTVELGEILETRAPSGSFVVDAAEGRPLVLVAAGIGITPILAMARYVAFEGFRLLKTRKTWIFYSSHSIADQAFLSELDEISRVSSGAVKVVKVLADAAGANPGIHYNEVGRITIDMLKRTLPFDDFDFYLCGPDGFMADMYKGLKSLNVSEDRIHAEAFGPSTLVRVQDRHEQVADEVADKSIQVIFTASAKEARWSPGDGSLLELAEARGLSPDFGCRSGSCGSCAVGLVQGRVTYRTPPTASVSQKQALICCAVPAKIGNDLVGGLQLDL